MSWLRAATGALLWGSLAHGGGFALQEQDAQATGRGGTALAHTGSPSAVHYNPAGLHGLGGLWASAGTTLLMPYASAINPATAEVSHADAALKYPPHLYVAYGRPKWSLGAGFNAPYGGGLKWPADWRGRFEVVEQQLTVLGGHLGASYTPTPKLTLGAAFSVLRVSVSVDKRQDFVGNEGTVLLTGTGLAFQPSLGVTARPRADLSLGLTAKLPAAAPLNGRAEFRDIPPAFAGTLQDQAIATRLTLPGKLGVGVEWQTEPVKLFFDGELTLWRAFQRFEVDFENANLPDVSQPRNWANAATLKLGAEKVFGPVTGRTGVLYDSAVSPAETLSPSSPDSHRLGLSLGGGRGFGRWQLDAAYALLFILPRAAEGETFAARYAVTLHQIALTGSFKPAPPPKVPAAKP